MEYTAQRKGTGIKPKEQATWTKLEKQSGFLKETVTRGNSGLASVSISSWQNQIHLTFTRTNKKFKQISKWTLVMTENLRYDKWFRSNKYTMTYSKKERVQEMGKSNKEKFLIEYNKMMRNKIFIIIIRDHVDNE